MKHFIAAIAASILATPAMAWNCDEERTINKEFDIGTLRDIQVQLQTKTCLRKWM